MSDAQRFSWHQRGTGRSPGGWTSGWWMEKKRVAGPASAGLPLDAAADRGRLGRSGSSPASTSSSAPRSHALAARVVVVLRPARPGSAAAVRRPARTRRGWCGRRSRGPPPGSGRGDRAPASALASTRARMASERVGRVARGVVGVDEQHLHAALGVVAGHIRQPVVPGERVGAVVAGEHHHGGGLAGAARRACGRRPRCRSASKSGAVAIQLPFQPPAERLAQPRGVGGGRDPAVGEVVDAAGETDRVGVAGRKQVAPSMRMVGEPTNRSRSASSSVAISRISTRPGRGRARSAPPAGRPAQRSVDGQPSHHSKHDRRCWPSTIART